MASRIFLGVRFPQQNVNSPIQPHEKTNNLPFSQRLSLSPRGVSSAFLQNDSRFCSKCVRKSSALSWRHSTQPVVLSKVSNKHSRKRSVFSWLGLGDLDASPVKIHSCSDLAHHGPTVCGWQVPVFTAAKKASIISCWTPEKLSQPLSQFPVLTLSITASD